MTSRTIRIHLIGLMSAVLAIVWTQNVNAQIVNFVPAGVEIDASGVLRMKTFADPTGELTRQHFEAAKAALSEELVKPSELRKISLNRLEKEIERRLENGESIDDAIRYMAGMTQITHVFYYPESKDIVVAGPAEGFYADASGRIVGMNSGRAVMRLEDLLVALRAFPPSGKSTQVIGCSIDPTQEGLANYQQVLGQMKHIQPSGNEGLIVNSLREALGKQKVTVQGISPQTHFAQVLVEADYRMKLIGIGLEQPPVDIPSFVEYVNPSRVADNAMQRWYFTPNYERIRVNPDETAMQMVGQGVKLIGADERVVRGGARVKSSRVSRASQNFTRKFTEKFGELSERSPVFAELRNLMDMSIAAAFIQEMDYYGQANWTMPTLSDESKLNTETYQTPEFVEAQINAIWKRGKFMTPIGGGVAIQPKVALSVDNMQTDEEGTIDETRQGITLDHLKPGQWWWD